MIYFVDIDKTICDTPETWDNYQACKPIYENIEKINKLWKDGHTIVYWTARGAKHNHASLWFDLTKNQLDSWGCLYSELRMGKPLYDIIIDDKAMRIEELE